MTTPSAPAAHAAGTLRRFDGFAAADFDVFAIPGLEARMSALIERVRPKLTLLGERLAPALSAMCGEEMFPHVAKHARRTVHPPNDTWVAFSANKRGYKALPHFQIGLFESHLFIQFAVIYEAPDKAAFARRALASLADIARAIPDHYVWSGDHTVAQSTPHGEMKNDGGLARLFERLASVKAAEVLCGIEIRRGDERLRDGEALIGLAEQTFETLLPLYRMARSAGSAV
ncbi:DUF1054 domain-containing protein [Paenibacillus cisolokensis]|uniref:UPF0637 protein PACILC2_00190 n=1 Tax=Paenibacillus cisolokensis TaxID=1658519 RepID=A0ABQ4MZV6_9BACL|nr:DUF1054 domain-containing protein [Paenibacillus cisolokensis]GIQ61451.1 UPF0637 protein YktB [Paenibacillus cisolokensis]